MPETLTQEPPLNETAHTAPPELERVFAMRRDELKPTVRTYADNLHTQILAIFAEHGAKNFADFERIAREKELPLSLLEDIQHRMNQLLHIIETQELPSTFVVSNAKNPYHDALTAGGLTDPTQNPSTWIGRSISGRSWTRVRNSTPMRSSPHGQKAPSPLTFLSSPQTSVHRSTLS